MSLNWNWTEHSMDDSSLCLNIWTPAEVPRMAEDGWDDSTRAIYLGPQFLSMMCPKWLLHFHVWHLGWKELESRRYICHLSSMLSFHMASLGFLSAWQSQDSRISACQLAPPDQAFLERESENHQSSSRQSRQKPQCFFYDLVSKVIHHYFCFILFIKSRLLSPAHTQGKGR